MRLQFIDEVVFDGSTNPGTVELNGWRLKFDSDDDAKAVFGLLNAQRDAMDYVIKHIDQISREIELLQASVNKL